MRTPARVRLPIVRGVGYGSLPAERPRVRASSACRSGRSSRRSMPACAFGTCGRHRGPRPPDRDRSAGFAWVLLHNGCASWRRTAPVRPPTQAARAAAADVCGGLVISWAGMRGIITLAAALALPHDPGSEPFPYRDLIVLTAFAVVFGTLVLQGLTLKPLIRLLRLGDDDPVGREVEAARGRALDAALSSIAEDESPAAEAVRLELTEHLGAHGGSRGSRRGPRVTRRRPPARPRSGPPHRPLDAGPRRDRRRCLPPARGGARPGRGGDLAGYSFTFTWSVIQLTSQVLPPSSENDCSKCGESVVVLVLLVQRTRIVPAPGRSPGRRTRRGRS